MGELPTNPRVTDSLHKTTIELAASIGAAVVAVYGIWALAVGDIAHLINGIGPAVLALIGLVMLRRRWYHGEVVLVAAAISTVVSFKYFGQTTAASPAMIGIVVIVSIGALFVVERWQRIYIWPATFGLLATGFFWEGFTMDALWTGVTGAFSALVTMILLIRVQASAVKLDRKYRVLVEKVPLPLLEEDWSPIRTWLDQLRGDGVTDIEAYLDEHPNELFEISLGAEVRAVNPAISQMFAPGDHYHFDEGLNHERLQPFFRHEVIAMWNGTAAEPEEFELVRKDGTPFWARVQAVDIEPGLIDNVDRVIVATDVTALKETQAQLAEQVRTKDEFVAAVSHELRTPLTSILGFAEVINEGCDTIDPQRAEYMGILLDQAADMAHIVEDLLVAARAEIGTVSITPQRLNLAELVDKTTTEAYEEFDVECGTEPWIYADPVRVTQIIRNLMSNATRYGGTKRSIHISKTDGFGVVEVRDNGDAIPAEVHDRIFEPYTRAQDRPGLAASVGLGLSISRQLARLMGGDVTYERTGDESVFKLCLPMAGVRAVGAA